MVICNPIASAVLKWLTFIIIIAAAVIIASF
jgi:hypothetical protein